VHTYLITIILYNCRDLI